MIVEAGHYALVLALTLAVIQSVLPLWGARTGDLGLMRIGTSSALFQLLFIAMAFGVLTYAYVSSDFSLTNVFENSHSAKPLIYKISGVWGNHEGSMLLWVLILAFFGGLVAAFGRNLPPTMKASVLAVQAWISVAFLLFILLTSNPFTRLTPAPMQGQDLNPILQDVGLAIHPPLLYLGYVGFSIAFAFAAAALIEGRIDAAWARWVRPWILLAWIFLTLGIAMGSYWAYYELGWGGWWFWDPVENASLMPWLAGTALLHSALVMEKRNALKVWTILLAILTFSLSLLGTFLVRSGVLTSVHAFATDPKRGVFMLAILVLFIGGGLSLFAWRASALKQGGIFAPISREGALILNNLLLTVSCFAVFIGTLYPLALEALTGGKVSVGPPFFDLTFGPLMLAVLVVMPFGPFLAWKRGDLTGAMQRLGAAIGLAILAALVTLWLKQGGPVLAPVGAGLAFFIMAGAVVEIAGRIKLFREPLGSSLRRATGLPRSAFGTAFAHFGVGVTLMGIVAASAWQSETIVAMKPGDTASFGRFQATYVGSVPKRGSNYTATEARFVIRRDGVEISRISSSKRFYPARQMPVTETGISTHGFDQIYIGLGDNLADGAIAARLYDKPLITLIWLGCLVMAFGGLLSLSDRRLRVGAPKPARRVAQTMQPAE
ncbi:heme lyase CcmF/NrfE family subunit [Labrys sp. KNU-23]|uniref:heme lyase CcmF/NrfE family subunit n=1 Tax=Labrys sp. KNU-23 TaxID=2789216 RepID=UPI0011EC7D15|nr:heme lyase CcmF/NrfE family subunit [Labrys sp. KNU-23]QEN90174.1 heme lyase CcmF/NrfE family subunit [Labrys sp. KNU-23]